MNENWEIYISTTSLVIALCALGVTVWQGKQNYRHNKMSVRPKLTASENYEDDEDGRNVTFELINSGFGPATIKEFVLYYDGKEISKNNREVYEEFLKKLAKDNGVDLLSLYSFIPESSLLAEEHFELFSFRHKKGQDVSFANKLNIHVKYQSIYAEEDKTFEYDSKRDRVFQGRKVRNA